MKRPLLVLAVVLCSGIWLLKWSGAFCKIFPPPSFRAAMEERGEDFRSGKLSGTVRKAVSNGEKYVLTVDSSREYGRVNAYLDASREAVGDLIGKRVTLSGSFFLYARSTNFGAYDVRAHYDAECIYLGFTAETIESAEGSGKRFRRAVFSLRESIRESVIRKSNDRDTGFFLSILLNDRSLLNDEESALYALYGFSSILSSSGFLAALMGYAFYSFIRKRVRSKGTAASLSVALLILYGGLTGFSASFIRAAIVSAVSIGASLLKRRFDILNASALSILLLILWSPGVVLLPAFLFWTALTVSFGIVFPAVQDVLFRHRKRYTFWIRALSTEVSILPVIVFLTYSSSVWSVVLSLLFYAMKLPLFFLLYGAVACDLAGASRVSDLFINASAALHRTELLAVRTVRGFPFGNVVNGRPDAWRFVVYAAVVFFGVLALRMLFFRRKRISEAKEKRITVGHYRIVLASLAAVSLFGILFLRCDPMRRDAVRVTMMDVGQGDGFLIETRDHTVLIDGGSSSREDVGTVIADTCHFFGRGTVDAWFLTHGDLDHVSGALNVINNETLPVRALYMPDVLRHDEEFSAVLSAADEKAIPVQFLAKGDTVRLGNLTFTVLSPERGEDLLGNDASLVTAVSFSETDMLFTGDISSEIESRLTLNGPYEILKIAHHGSRFSSSAGFLENVRPKIALVSCGARNVYGHPSDEAMGRVLEASPGVVVFKTGEDGAVSITARGERITVRSP